MPFLLSKNPDEARKKGKGDMPWPQPSKPRHASCVTVPQYCNNKYIASKLDHRNCPHTHPNFSRSWLSLLLQARDCKVAWYYASPARSLHPIIFLLEFHWHRGWILATYNVRWWAPLEPFRDVSGIRVACRMRARQANSNYIPWWRSRRRPSPKDIDDIPLVPLFPLPRLVTHAVTQQRHNCIHGDIPERSNIQASVQNHVVDIYLLQSHQAHSLQTFTGSYNLIACLSSLALWSWRNSTS